MTREIQELFPSGRLSKMEISQEGLYSLPLSKGNWWVIDGGDLTEREQVLLEFLQDRAEEHPTSPWQSYLYRQGPLPQTVETIQFIHVHLWSQKEAQLDAWQSMMMDLLPSQLAHVQLTAQDHLFVLEQSLWTDYQTLLAATLSTLEFDFGLRLTLLVGQVWPRQLAERWPQLYQLEATLFAQWRTHYQQSAVLSFCQLFLWGQGKAGLEFSLIKTSMLELIDQQDMQDIILALWTEGAVVTKAAQALYIHRNTLQYRLDKWQDITGLQLKNLTDLSFCYQVLSDRLY